MSQAPAPSGTGSSHSGGKSQQRQPSHSSKAPPSHKSGNSHRSDKSDRSGDGQSPASQASSHHSRKSQQSQQSHHSHHSAPSIPSHHSTDRESQRASNPQSEGKGSGSGKGAGTEGSVKQPSSRAPTLVRRNSHDSTPSRASKESGMSAAERLSAKSASMVAAVQEPSVKLTADRTSHASKEGSRSRDSPPDAPPQGRTPRGSFSSRALSDISHPASENPSQGRRSGDRLSEEALKELAQDPIGVVDLMRERDRLSIALSDAEAKAEVTKAELGKVRSAKAESIRSERSSRNRAIDAEEEVAALRRKLANQEKDWENRFAELKAARSRDENALNSLLRSEEARNASFQDQLRELKEANRGGEREVSHYKRDDQALLAAERREVDLRRELKALQQERGQVYAERDRLKEEVSHQNRTTRRMERDLEEAGHQVNSLKRRMEGLAEEVERKHKRISDDEVIVMELKEQIWEKDQHILELQDCLDRCGRVSPVVHGSPPPVARRVEQRTTQLVRRRLTSPSL